MQQQFSKEELRKAHGIRMRIFGVSFVIWLMMACWTTSAFWADIDKLGGGMGRYVGAMTAEFTILVFTYWHAFDEHISVRRLSLVLGIALSICAVIHAGALTSIESDGASKAEKRKALSDELTNMTNGMIAGETDKRTRRQAIQAAQRQLAEHVEKEKEVDTLLPESYRRKWMYSGMFILSLLCFGYVVWVRMEKGDTDIDRNFDGIPDSQQQSQVNYFPSPQPQIHYVQVPVEAPQQLLASNRIVGLAPPPQNAITGNLKQSKSMYFGEKPNVIRVTPNGKGYAVWERSEHRGQIDAGVWERIEKTPEVILANAKRKGVSL